jgi:Uma2 family endonuclease
MAVMSASLEYPRKHLISADEYLRMGEIRVFAPDARLELVEGELIEMAPIHPPHAGCVNTLIKLFAPRVGEKALISVQNTLVASTRSVPEPDFVLLEPRADNYRDSHPSAVDVLLAIEVSDTTLAFDLRVKVPLYARCGIPETWIVDVNERVIHVFRDAGASGYATRLTVAAGQAVACAALPAVVIQAEELFS